MCGIVGYVGSKTARPSSSTGCASSSTAATTRRASPSTRAAASRSCAPSASSRTSTRRSKKNPLAGTTGHRPHALGDARPPERGERAPARRRAASPSSTTASSRTTSRFARELEAQRRQASRATPTPRSSRTSSTTRCKSGAHEPRRGRPRGARAGARRVRDRRRVAATRPTRSSSRRTTRRSSSASATARRCAASDIPALLAHTRDMIFLEDGEMAVLTRAGRRASTTLDGTPVDARAEAHRLVADAGREGRLQALHAQGDPRAAARHRGHAARPRRSRRARDVVAAEIGVTRRAREEASSASTSSPAARAPTPRWPAATGSSSSRASRRRSRSAARSATAIRSSSRTISSSP